MVVVLLLVVSKVADTELYRLEIRASVDLIVGMWNLEILRHVVYIAFRTVAENLKIGEISSKLFFYRFMEFRYFGDHFE